MTDWQARYAINDTPWDKGAAAPPLLEMLADQPFAGNILVPGCGFGHDVRAISNTNNLVVGFDLAQTAVLGAEQFPVTGNEHYLTGDFFQLPPEMHGAFDIVFEHTCFCAIDPTDRLRYVESVKLALRSGGELRAIFYLNPGHEQGPPFPVRETELDGLFGKYFDLIKKYIPKASFAGRENREQIRIYRLRANS